MKAQPSAPDRQNAFAFAFADADAGGCAHRYRTEGSMSEFDDVAKVGTGPKHEDLSRA